MRMIEERPNLVEKRQRIGDCEGETMIGKDYKQAIVVNVEQKSGLLCAKKMPQKTA